MTLIAERVRELTGARQPFVHATVVRAQAPTSAMPGDDAVILADGSIEGFVGGVCAETSVRAAALDTLRDGNTMLLRVLPDGAASFPDAPGAQVVVNPCLSGGAIEIFLRPMLPRPLIGVAGATTPIGAAVVTLAGFLDLEITEPMAYAGASAVVVAGLGRDDEQVIRAALDAGVPLISLVASRTRGAAVLDSLGLTAEERARVRPHAGIDIGARTHQEIALSVLAEIVRELRASSPEPVAAAPTRTAIDPICGMTVVIGEGTPHAVVDGVEHWFCCAGCRDRFVAAS
ncbi:XdhC family protein [Paractinoplanes rhizophilus]|uniref:XdhC family protein n=1 Tax=Paractinoplanes rhizophilus TaxID=1416877 RepID=A0ABW2I0K4_9ACTN